VLGLLVIALFTLRLSPTEQHARVAQVAVSPPTTPRPERQREADSKARSAGPQETGHRGRERRASRSSSGGDGAASQASSRGAAHPSSPPEPTASSAAIGGATSAGGGGAASSAGGGAASEFGFEG
jgi:hypothetical protein